MREIKIKKLTKESFEKFGSFVSMVKPETAGLGEAPNEFFRDMIQMKMGRTVASHAICRIKKQPLIIKEVEYSNHFEKGIMPIDGDIVVFVAEATPASQIPFDKFEAFLVPIYTMVKLRVGVWHHAPFGYDQEVTNVVIFTPDRFVVNDIFVQDLEEKDRILIKE